VKRVVVTGGFDDLRSTQVRFLQEAAHLGAVQVRLWSDAFLHRQGQPPKFPEAERAYLLQALRYVHEVTLVRDADDATGWPELPDLQAGLWVVDPDQDRPALRLHCAARQLPFQVIPPEHLCGFPELVWDPPAATLPARKKVLVTGCYDWFHSGHVRFFEEASVLGDLYVVVGHDANLRALKGEGHPLFPQEERRYLVQSVRYVKHALISTGQGWLDAEPEIQRLRPDIYVVNEDGDRPVKREYCAQHGLEYRVLQRLPKDGLSPRQSTRLRGF